MASQQEILDLLVKITVDPVGTEVIREFEDSLLRLDQKRLNTKAQSILGVDRNKLRSDVSFAKAEMQRYTAIRDSVIQRAKRNGFTTADAQQIKLIQREIDKYEDRMLSANAALKQNAIDAERAARAQARLRQNITASSLIRPDATDSEVNAASGNLSSVISGATDRSQFDRIRSGALDSQRSAIQNRAQLTEKILNDSLQERVNIRRRLERVQKLAPKNASQQQRIEAKIVDLKNRELVVQEKINVTTRESVRLARSYASTGGVGDRPQNAARGRALRSLAYYGPGGLGNSVFLAEQISQAGLLGNLGATASAGGGLALGPLALIAGGLVTAGITFAAAVKGFKDAVLLQSQTARLQTSLGSEGLGNFFAKEVERIAGATPLTQKKALEDAGLVLSSGLGVNKAIKLFSQIADVQAVATNANLKNILVNIAQVRLATSAQQRDIREFAIQGIDIYSALRESLNRNDVSEAIKEGAVDATVLEDAFRRLTQRGGQAFDAANRQQRTFEGALKQIGETSAFVLRDIMKSPLSGLTDVLISLDEVLRKIKGLPSRDEIERETDKDRRQRLVETLATTIMRDSVSKNNFRFDRDRVVDGGTIDDQLSKADRGVLGGINSGQFQSALRQAQLVREITNLIGRSGKERNAVLQNDAREEQRSDFLDEYVRSERDIERRDLLRDLTAARKSERITNLQLRNAEKTNQKPEKIEGLSTALANDRRNIKAITERLRDGGSEDVKTANQTVIGSAQFFARLAEQGPSQRDLALNDLAVRKAMQRGQELGNQLITDSNRVERELIDTLVLLITAIKKADRNNGVIDINIQGIDELIERTRESPEFDGFTSGVISVPN